MIKGIVASVIAAAICALFGWLWFAFFSTAFFEHPLAFILCGVIALTAGIAIGSTIGWAAKKKQQNDEAKRSLDAAEHEFRTMSFSAKGLCLIPGKDGVRKTSGKEDANIDFDGSDWREAVRHGFILIEDCGTHQHRIHPTEKLTELFEAKPEIAEEVHQDFVKDFTENYVIQQIMGDDGRMSPPKVVDRFTGEETDRWSIGGKRR